VSDGLIQAKIQARHHSSFRTKGEKRTKAFHFGEGSDAVEARETLRAAFADPFAESNRELYRVSLTTVSRAIEATRYFAVPRPEVSKIFPTPELRRGARAKTAIIAGRGG